MIVGENIWANPYVVIIPVAPCLYFCKAILLYTFICDTSKIVRHIEWIDWMRTEKASYAVWIIFWSICSLKGFVGKKNYRSFSPFLDHSNDFSWICQNVPAFGLSSISPRICRQDTKQLNRRNLLFHSLFLLRALPLHAGGLVVVHLLLVKQVGEVLLERARRVLVIVMPWSFLK